MPKRRAGVFAFLLLAACASRRSEIEARLLPIVEAARPREVAVAYEDFASGDQATVNADVVMHAASTMKLAVLIEVLGRSERGELPLESRIPVVNRFRSIVDGSEFALDPRDDEDPELYAHLGEALAVRDLARRMIVRSSNLATNLLFERVTAQSVQRTIESLGTQRMQVLRGVEDQKAYDAGISNVTTARDLAVLLRSLLDGKALSRASTDEALEILLAQEFGDMIPAGLPRGTPVAHKTGDITRIRHDAAIVDPKGPRPYVLVVLTRGFDDPEESAAIVARIAREIHAARSAALHR